MALETPRDLFLHELSDTMSAEHIVLQMLGDLEAESGNDDVKAAVKHHQDETKQQIENLEAVMHFGWGASYPWWYGHDTPPPLSNRCC